jgi:hypothetical protein
VRDALPRRPRTTFRVVASVPDLTPHIRDWFADAGFSELAFVAPEEALFSVGMSRFLGAPQPLRRGQLFRFTR